MNKTNYATKLEAMSKIIIGRFLKKKVILIKISCSVFYNDIKLKKYSKKYL